MSSATRLVRYVAEHLYLCFAAMTPKRRVQHTMTSLWILSASSTLWLCQNTTLLSLTAFSWTNSVGANGLTSE